MHRSARFDILVQELALGHPKYKLLQIFTVRSRIVGYVTPNPPKIKHLKPAVVLKIDASLALSPLHRHVFSTTLVLSYKHQ